MPSRIFLLALSLFSLTAQSAIHPRSGGYSRSWVDVQNSKYKEVGLRRTYNSKSAASGVFGVGQCTEFETKVVLEATGDVALVFCGSGKAKVFSKTKRRGFDSLIQKFKAKDATINPAAFARDFNYRAQFKKLILTKASKQIPAGRYWAIDGDGTLTAKSSKISVQMGNGESFEFDSLGRVVKYSSPEKSWDLTYRKQRITKIRFRQGALSLTYDSKGLVSKLSDGAGATARYTYERGRLKSVQNGWGNLYSFKYGKSGLIRSVAFPDKTSEAIKYDSKGRVVQFIDRRGCKETFSRPIRGALKEVLVSQKKCGKTTVLNQRLESTFKKNRRGYVKLFKKSEKINGMTTERFYNVDNGTLARTVKERSALNIMGKRQVASVLKEETSYGSLTKPGSLQTTFETVSKIKSPKNKRLAQRKLRYRLNAQKKVTWLQNYDGEKVSAKYTKTGLLQSVSSNKSPTLYLKYDKRRRPVSMGLEDKGEVKVAYNSGDSGWRIVKGAPELARNINLRLRRYKEMFEVGR